MTEITQARRLSGAADNGAGTGSEPSSAQEDAEPGDRVANYFHTIFD